MEAIKTIYQLYGWQIISGSIFLGLIFVYLLYLFICYKLTKGANEFTDCVDEKTIYRVGITNYTTEFGAKKRCEYLYKRHGVDAEVTLLNDYEEHIKLHASDIWDLKK